MNAIFNSDELVPIATDLNDSAAAITLPVIDTAPAAPVLRKRVITYKMYKSAKCLRKLLMEHQKTRGYISPNHAVARVVGKIVETILKGIGDKTITSVEQADAILHAGLAALPPEDRRKAFFRVSNRVQRGLELDAQEEKATKSPKRKRNFAPQYYASITVKVDGAEEVWQLAAQPDKVEMNGEEGFVPDSIDIIDSKTGGKVTEYMLGQLDWFGMVVSLWLKEQIRMGALKYRSHQMARRKGAHHTSRRRFGAFEPPIRLFNQLLGRVQTELGWIDAVQPQSTKYDRRLEESAVGDAKHVIKKIAIAFKTNEFPATESSACNECSHREGCAGFARWAAAHPESVQPLPDNRGWVRAPQFNSRGFTPWQPDPAASLPAVVLPLETPQPSVAA